MTEDKPCYQSRVSRVLCHLRHWVADARGRPGPKTTSLHTLSQCAPTIRLARIKDDLMAASVQLLVAYEEEVRKRSAVKAAKYTGPLLRTRSLQVDGAALVSPPDLMAPC